MKGKESQVEELKAMKEFFNKSISQYCNDIGNRDAWVQGIRATFTICRVVTMGVPDQAWQPVPSLFPNRRVRHCCVQGMRSVTGRSSTSK